MGIEIERRFLVQGEPWQAYASTGILFTQGYLSTDPTRTVRVRLEGTEAFITIKGVTVGAKRSEFTYSIPFVEGQTLLATLTKKPLIEKTRYKIPYAEQCFDVDVFAGVNAGLVLAEIELRHEAQAIALPPWLGKEVTHDGRYANASLVHTPFSQW